MKARQLIESISGGIPEVVRKKRTRVEEYQECPVCHQEIGEKELYCPNIRESVWVHRPCGGKFTSTPTEETRNFMKQFGLGEYR